MQPSDTRPGRYNIYAYIHKGLRMFMSDTLCRLGSADPRDLAGTREAIAQVRTLVRMCASHLKHENDFIHAAMESRRPGSSAALAKEHDHHTWALGEMTGLAHAAETATEQERPEALAQLYRYLALFVAENFTHMNVEETEHNAVLWATHSDAELAGIEQVLVASIPPEESALTMRWMIPAMNAAERAAKLGPIRQHAPAPVFGMLMQIARENLPAGEWRKLQQDLGLEQPLAA